MDKNELKKTEKLITDLYNKILLREPDKKGLEYFSSLVLQGKHTIESVKQEMLNSTEYLQTSSKYDFSKDGKIPKGFFDDYQIFQESSNTGRNLNRLNCRYKAIIDSNKWVFTDANVLDLGSHDGRWSFAAFKNNAKSVVGIEARDHLVKNAEMNIAKLDIPKEKIVFRLGDVNTEIKNIEKNSYDVIMCLGFFYHTIEHWKILSEIKRINPKYLILDTNISTLNNDVIEIYFEYPKHEANAYFQQTNSESVLVGKPSRFALELMLKKLDFDIKFIDWNTLGIQNWKHIVEYYKGERITLLATNTLKE